MSKQQKMYRRMHHLMGAVPHCPRKISIRYLTEKTWHNSQKQQLECHLLCDKLNIDEEVRERVWRGVWCDRHPPLHSIDVANRNQYMHSERGVIGKRRQDNKGVYVGSGGGGWNSIRYPRKVRKTAWKRFYKLFPNLDPKNKKNDTNTIR